MAMQKKANGANFKVGGGELRVRFATDGPALVYVVCIWGPKPEFGGQRAKMWCTETLSVEDGSADVAVPEGMAIAGAQVTWSGGLISPGAVQGRLVVAIEQDGAESPTYSYEYHFTEKNQTESFYDGLNFS